ncbi:MAG: hypothetical protein ACKOOL_07920 [Novosphingobium sp.]
MSKHQRKPAKGKPITANPLFPAVVALWFGALFGLGSLAVRPSLLEDLVLKSHIDLVIPAAAPPLGITARILLALVLAALGAVIGIALARRLTRPKVEARERKRGAKELNEDTPRIRSRDAHPDAPARRPISAHEEFGDEEPFEAARSSGGIMANRRRALAIVEEEPEFVPHEAAPLPGVDSVQPLDLASLALPADPPPVSHATFTSPASAPASSLDWTRSAPASAAAIEPAAISAEAAHRDGRQVFGMTPPVTPDPAPRQIFGIQAENDHLPQDFVQAAGFQTSVFDTPEPSPLFERAAETPAAPMPMADFVAPEHVEAVVDPVQAPAVPVAIAEPDTVDPLPSPSTLGMTDLAARLAESMRRRRERAQSAAASAAAVSPIAPATATPPPAELLSAIQEPAEPAAALSPISAPVEEARTQPLPAPAAPVADPLPRFAAQVPEVPVAAAPTPAAIPAAMRPLALDAFLEDDAALEDTSFLPPRHITMPQPVQVAAQFVAPQAFEEPATNTAADTEVAVEESLADVAEDNPYASLLELNAVRPGHVRIEDAEPAPGAEIEPVVIFPGQAGHVVPLAAPSAQAHEEPGFRRFDSPDLAGQGQPVAGTPAASLIPAEEAAQALRAALSNLQRMSGAA